MLEFIKLEIDNFGPYKDKQVLEFKDGVTIIWGDNGRGKTTLLNAFRYALFGRIVRRSKNKKTVLTRLCNLENASKGKYGFSVALTLRHNGVEFELIRRYDLKPDVSVPRSDADFSEEVSLKRGNSYLSADERDHYLNMIMPEQIARFFLFDGELLSEYEDLIDDDKAIGAKIKESIEKILGVPILINAHNDVKNALELMQDDYKDLVRKDDRSKEIIRALDAAKLKLVSLQRSQNDYKEERDSKFQEKAILEDELRRTEKIRLLLERKENLKKNISSNEIKRDECRAELKNYTKQAWLGILADLIAKKTTDIEAEIRKLEEKRLKANAVSRQSIVLTQALASKICPTCGRELNLEHQNTVQKKLEDFRNLEPEFTEKDSIDLEEQRKMRAKIKKHINDNIKSLIHLTEDKLSTLIVEISDARGQVEDLDNDIGSKDDPDHIMSQKAEYNKVISSITLLNQEIENNQREIDNLTQSMISLNDKLGKMATGGGSIKLSKVIHSTGRLKELLHKGIDVYRDRLKEKIEIDASILFRSISSEPDYVKLNINDNYGLNIVYEDGQINEDRSAGYEHIVAISLIGSLQKNAPMSGPVVMDSPFGRLDIPHSRRISSALESLSHQVILFAYEGEIDMQTARETLGSNLTHEYYLKRVSGKHTQITTLKDA